MPADLSEQGISAPQDAVDRFLRGLPHPARLLVAVSGGSDSTALLHLLHRAVQDGRHPGLSICAATVDHGLRAESAAEAAGVAATCSALSIDHRILRWNGPKPSAGLAAAAREARYALLCEAATGFAADLIVSAHTAEDQVETVSMRAARNDDAASPGLAGMAPAVMLEGRIWLFRPLLGCRRADLRARLTAGGFGWFDDPSNENLAYERPRQRQALDGADLVSMLPAILVAQRRRFALSAAAADFVRASVTIHGGVVAGIAPQDMDDIDDDVLSYALAHLAAVIGGRAHTASVERMLPVIGLCRTGELGRLTVSRVVFDKRRSGLFILREQRGLVPLMLGPGGSGVWDARYRVVNESKAPVVVAAFSALDAGRVGELFAGLPPGVARAAAGTLPVIDDSMGPALPLGGTGGEGVRAERFLAPFDRFLPLFDRKLAHEIAARFGLRRYDLPFRGSLGENEC